MSYILDALKKVEREKSRKSADGRVSLAGSLLHESRPSKARSKVLPVAAVAFAIAIAASLGIWYLYPSSGPDIVAAPRPVAQAQPQPPPAPAPSTPPLSEPSVAPPMTLPPHSSPPVSQLPQVTSPVTPQAGLSSPSVSAENEDAEGSSTKRRKLTKDTPRETRQPSVPQSIAPSAIQPPADIKLAGIAWQEERSARKAVVNGFLLKEGSDIAGVRIKEIFPDRVRFTSASGEFEMRLDSLKPLDTHK